MLVQPVKGHRAGLDAALLQALVPGDAEGHAVDLGTGVGTVALSLAARVSGISAAGIERDASLVALARTALARPENAGFAHRVTIVEADVTALRAAAHPSLAERSADWVLMNPPWDTPGRVRASPDAARRGAHMAERRPRCVGPRRGALAEGRRVARPDPPRATASRAAGDPRLDASATPGSSRFIPRRTPRRRASSSAPQRAAAPACSSCPA